MIEQNSILKENYDSYDLNKDKYFQNIIDNLESEHQDDLKKKYSNPDNLNKYIRNLETTINKYKIQETEQLKSLENVNDKLKKQEKINSSLKDQIEYLKSKLNNVPDYEKLQEEINNYDNTFDL